MITRKMRIGGLAALSTLLVASVAFATVNFDAEQGTGFVGKGDVQLPFEWSNAQLQANAAGVVFTYHDQDEYDVTCTKTIETKKETKVLRNVLDRVLNVNSTVNFETRKNNKGMVTGFTLTGATTTESGNIGCPDSWTLESSELVGSGNGQLTASHAVEGKSAVIWSEDAGSIQP